MGPHRPHAAIWLANIASLSSLFLAYFLAQAQDAAKAPDEKKDAPDEKTIRALIAELGDESFEKREAAQKRLTAYGELPLAQLNKALKESTDAEVRKRLSDLVQAIHSSFFVEVRSFRGLTFASRLAVTPDGRRVVAAGLNFLRSWNVADGNEVVDFEWPGTISKSWGFALSPDGRQVIVGSDDRAARVFDMKTGKMVNQLKGHSSGVFGVALLPDGKRAITGEWNRALRIWDVDSGKVIRAFENVPDDIRCMALSPDGKLIAVGHTTGDEMPATISLWDVETGRQIHALKGHTKSISTVNFSPNGEKLVSSSFDTTVRLWDVKKGHLLQTFRGHPDRVTNAVLSVDGKRMLSVGGQAILVMWDVASAALLYKTAPGKAPYLNVVALPDNRHCITCSNDGVVRLWRWER